MLLRQYVQEALAAKASGGSTKLYDQCVPPPAAPLLVTQPIICCCMSIAADVSPATLSDVPSALPLRPQVGERGQAAASSAARPRTRCWHAPPSSRPRWRRGAAGGAAARAGRLRQPGA